METQYEKITIGIIGAGRAGSSMGALFKRAGHRVLIWDQAPEAWEHAAHWLGDHPLGGIEMLLLEAQWLLVALPDQGIRSWVTAHLIDQPLPRQLVGLMHLSGAMGTEVFGDLPQELRRIALHPMRAFAAPVLEQNGLATTYFGVTADTTSTAQLWRDLLPEIAPRMLDIPEAQRSLYHAAAVMASNFTVPLLLDAQEMYRQCGIEAQVAAEIISGLVRSAVDNFTQLPSHQVLTGPLTRGDASTVAGHLRALAQYPELEAHYRSLCYITLELARHRLDEATYRKLLATIHVKPLEVSL